jgi:hypothetical protein
MPSAGHKPLSAGCASRMLFDNLPGINVDAIPGEKSFRVSVIHVKVHVKGCERLIR